MTTLVPFQPLPSANFTFAATFDGGAYNVIATWNYFGQRYYLTINTAQGAAVVTLPLIGSPDDYDISMTAGYFATTLIYRVSTGNFEISVP